MPLNSFYTSELLESKDGYILYQISIDENHPIYQGHFPEQPVTPGVILLEILRSLISQQTNCSLMMKQAKEIKFLAPVLPAETTTFQLKIDYTVQDKEYIVTSQFKNDKKVFTKIKAIFSAE